MVMHFAACEITPSCDLHEFVVITWRDITVVAVEEIIAKSRGPRWPWRGDAGRTVGGTHNSGRGQRRCAQPAAPHTRAAHAFAPALPSTAPATPARGRRSQAPSTATCSLWPPRPQAQHTGSTLHANDACGHGSSSRSTTTAVVHPTSSTDQIIAHACTRHRRVDVREVRARRSAHMR